MQKKSNAFYLNIVLSMFVFLLLVNTFTGNALVNRAMAAITTITGEGTINYLSRFAGAANPSNQIGDSLIYDSGTKIGIGTANPAQVLDVVGNTQISSDNPRYILRSTDANTSDRIIDISGVGSSALLRFYKQIKGSDSTNVYMTIGSDNYLNLGTGISFPDGSKQTTAVNPRPAYTATCTPGANYSSCDATCAAGYTATGGGMYYYDGDDSHVELSQPMGNNAWRCWIYDGASHPTTTMCYAQCVAI